MLLAGKTCLISGGGTGIGRAAALLIEKGDIIALTPGTTTTEVIRGLPRNHDITVVTSTVNVAVTLVEPETFVTVRL